MIVQLFFEPPPFYFEGVTGSDILLVFYIIGAHWSNWLVVKLFVIFDRYVR